MAVDLPADVKPKIKSDVAGTESIQIHVRGTESGKLSFKVKQSTKFFKVFDVYCKNKGIDPLQTRFLFDGIRIDMEKTPADYEMEEGDVIDAMLHQVGGC